jgi:hypothetical protein
MVKVEQILERVGKLIAICEVQAFVINRQEAGLDQRQPRRVIADAVRHIARFRERGNSYEWKAGAQLIELAHCGGYGPVGSAASAGQSNSAFATLVSVALKKFEEHSAPPPGCSLAGGLDRSAHCPGAIPSGVKAPPCLALGDLA